MPIAPALPLTGLAGFRFLEKTMDQQVALFNKSPDIQREIDHFLENAGNFTSVDQLVADRRSLSVVLGAFGLDDDIDKRAFIRKVIEEGTFNNRSFANRLVDPAYREMSSALGFGDVGGLLVFESTRLNIVDRFRERQFELAVGEVDLDMRLALNFKREISDIAGKNVNSRTGWLLALGSPPLRQVVETALNLPTEFGLIDVDQQVDEVADRASRLFGFDDVSALQDPALVDKFVDRFLLQQQVRNGAGNIASSGSVALSLLSASGLGGGAQSNLFASNFL
jgi:hypothetical protein